MNEEIKRYIEHKQARAYKVFPLSFLFECNNAIAKI